MDEDAVVSTASPPIALMSCVAGSLLPSVERTTTLCHCTVFVLNRRKSAVYYSSVHINTHRECGEHLGQCERATERRTDPGRYIADRQCCPHMSKSAGDIPQYNELLM